MELSGWRSWKGDGGVEDLGVHGVGALLAVGRWWAAAALHAAAIDCRRHCHHAGYNNDKGSSWSGGRVIACGNKPGSRHANQWNKTISSVNVWIKSIYFDINHADNFEYIFPMTIYREKLFALSRNYIMRPREDKTRSWLLSCFSCGVLILSRACILQ
jgi:hypothetical protein